MYDFMNDLTHRYNCVIRSTIGVLLLIG